MARRIVEIHELHLATGTVPVRVTVNRQARRLILKADTLKGEVLLTCPSKAAIRQGLKFAQSREAWLTEQLASGPQQTVFTNGAIVPYRGTPYTIRHFPDARFAVREVPSLNELHAGGGAVHTKRRIEDWLRKQARECFTELADQFCTQLAVTRRRLTIRDTKSRWGSCSSDGAIMLSWRLIMAPPHAYRYVVAHEVAHLVHLDHSPAFWRIVDQLVDNRASATQWLEQHGNALYGIGAASVAPACLNNAA